MTLARIQDHRSSYAPSLRVNHVYREERGGRARTRYQCYNKGSMWLHTSMYLFKGDTEIGPSIQHIFLPFYAPFSYRCFVVRASLSLPIMYRIAIGDTLREAVAVSSTRIMPDFGNVL